MNIYLLKKGSVNGQIRQCVLMKKAKSVPLIVIVYVDDLNIIEILEEIRQTVTYLKSEFEMKYLETVKICIGLQFEHTMNGIFIH